MSYNPNPTIEWPKCWSPHYTGPSLIGWNTQNKEDKRLKDISYATQIAYIEITQLENHTEHSWHP